MSYKGKYKVRNRDKYVGDYNKVTYRSSWELAYMKWADRCERVLAWGSEEIIVPYKCPTDNKIHKYYTDFYVKAINEKTGLITENIIEIKPHKETLAPRRGKNKKSYLYAVKSYVKNQAKWKAATKYATERGMSFFVLTENDLILPYSGKKNVK